MGEQVAIPLVPVDANAERRLNMIEDLRALADEIETGKRSVDQLVILTGNIHPATMDFLFAKWVYGQYTSVIGLLEIAKADMIGEMHD